jgi:membrane-associated phospholipid phosphatase
MNYWFLISVLGMAELWAVICAAMVVSYLVLRKTRWKVKTTGSDRFKAITILFVLSFAITFLMVYTLKIGFAVPRECILCPANGCNPYCLPDSAFPSGHAATIFAFFTSFALITRSRRSVGVLALAVLVTYSRLALGVHSVVDVTAGAALGAVIVIIVWGLERHFKWGKITPKEGDLGYLTGLE